MFTVKRLDFVQGQTAEKQRLNDSNGKGLEAVNLA